MLYLDRQNR